MFYVIVYTFAMCNVMYCIIVLYMCVLHTCIHSGTGRTESVFDIFREDVTTGAQDHNPEEHEFVEVFGIIVLYITVGYSSVTVILLGVNAYYFQVKSGELAVLLSLKEYLKSLLKP